MKRPPTSSLKRTAAMLPRSSPNSVVPSARPTEVRSEGKKGSWQVAAPLSVTLHAGGLRYLPVTLLSRAVVTLLAAPGAGFRNRPLPSPQPFAAPSLLFAHLFPSPPSLNSPSAAPSLPWSCWSEVGWGRKESLG